MWAVSLADKRAHAREALGVVELDRELFRQLTVHRFDDLPCPVAGAAHRRGHLPERMAAGQRQQVDPVGRSLTEW